MRLDKGSARHVLTNLAFTAKHKTNIATGNLDGLWVRYNPNKFLQSSVLTLASNY